MNFFQKNCSIFYCTFESFAPHGGPRCDKFLSLQQYFLFCLYLEFSGWFWTQVRGVMQATVLILHHSENAVQFSFFPHTSLQWVMHGHSQANVSLPMYLQLIKGNDDSCCDHIYMITVPIVVQKGITVAKLIFCWHTKNLDLPTFQVIIHLGQQILLWHDHCSILRIFLAINMEGYILECYLQVIDIYHSLAYELKNNFIPGYMIW